MKKIFSSGICLTIFFAGSVVSCNATTVGNKTVADVFKSTDVQSLADAACEGDTETISTLLQSGVDINAKGLDGVSPVMWALACGNFQGYSALLDKGANPNQENDFKNNTVTLAASVKNSLFLEKALAAGGDLNSSTNGKISGSALFTAYELGRETSSWNNYKLLLDMGAKLSDNDKFGKNIAVLAVYTYRDFCTAKDLVEKDATLLNKKLTRALQRNKVQVNDEEQVQCRAELLKKV